MVSIIEDLVKGVEENGRCPKATTRRKQDVSVIFAGVAVASSCQVVLPIFGALFLIVGLVLTIASYRGPESDEDAESYADRLNLTSHLRILGPICLVIGVCMFIAGIALCLLARRNKHNNITFHCPIHGDFYPISGSHNILPLKKRSSIVCGQKTDSGDSFPTPQCPHSNRSSLISTGPPPQPSPLPPVNTNHISGFLTPMTQTTGENSGSTQSLAISYDVASFPHSRSTTPTGDIEMKTRPGSKSPERKTSLA